MRNYFLEFIVVSSSHREFVLDDSYIIMLPKPARALQRLLQYQKILHMVMKSVLWEEILLSTLPLLVHERF